eukprot:gene8641-8822_t
MSKNDLTTHQRKLQILCLHGSRQDGEVFSQRLKTLRKKLASIAAIFGREYHLVSLNPPCFTIKLRDPSDPGALDAEAEDEGTRSEDEGTGGPPSRLFTLRFKLPKDYPTTAESLPVIEVEGPLGKNDPARAALLGHLTAAAAEQQQEMGGTGGYAWQNAGLQGGTKDTGGGGVAQGSSSSSLSSWGEWELHLLVAHFLAARFPILLALNKGSGIIDDAQVDMSGPLSDLSKAAKTVLYGDTTGEGAFVPEGAKLTANSMTADGVVLNLATSLSPQGVVTPSFTTMYSPSKNLMLMGIMGTGGALTGAATVSNLLGVSGLQATITTTPPVINTSTSDSVTLDYIATSTRLRAVVTPAPGKVLSTQALNAEVSATSSLGPCVIGAKVAGDSSGRVGQWSLGANWTRLVSEGNVANSSAGVSSLTGQQFGVVVTDSCPGRTATLSFHQLLAGGATTLAAEYTLPLQPTTGGSVANESFLAMGVARRLSTGGLVKARLDQTGTLALMYQQQLSQGAGKVSISCTCDPLALNKVAPKLGVALSVV